MNRLLSRRAFVPLIGAAFLALMVYVLPAAAQALWGDEGIVSAPDSCGGTLVSHANFASAENFSRDVTVSVTHSTGATVGFPSTVVVPAHATSASYNIDYPAGAGGDYLEITLTYGSDTHTHRVGYPD